MQQIEHRAAPEWFDEVPRSITRQTIWGLLIMILAIGGFGAWSFRAPLAAAVIAQGSFVATGNNKIVQHLEGGIISAIYIEEGDRVTEGQRLLSLDRTAAEASGRELSLRRMRLKATSERLLAEYREADRLTFSQELEEARHDPEIAAILDGQRLSYEVSRNALTSEINLFERSILALRVRERGYEAQLGSLRLRSEILAEEFADKTTLFERGLIEKSELNALRRMKAESDGQV